MKLSRLSVLLIVTLLLFVASVSQASGVVVIVNPNVEDSSLDKDLLTRIYQGKVSRWHSDSKVVPVMLKDGPTHETFTTDYMGTTPSRFRTYWKQAVFSGRGIPPKSFDSELELVKYVASTPGAIGYVSPLTPLTGVKKLTIR
ncbi:substrate-binding domain-containing protein [bacterium]|nr:substrate-binding domain-containing protein [bacterium]